MSTHPLRSTAEQLRDEITKTIELLGTLRDEARVELHLARMDAQTQWRHIAARAHRASLASQEAVRQSLREFEEFRASFKADPPKS